MNQDRRDELDEIALAKLAREMVMNVRSYKQVFSDFGIDEEDYYEIEKNLFFKKIKDQFTIEWNSALSSEERLRLVSFAYLEQLAPVLTRRAMRSDEPLVAATGVGKLLAQAAGVGGERGGEKTMSERFVITINMGEDVETYNKSIEIKADDTPLLYNGTATHEDGRKRPYGDK